MTRSKIGIIISTTRQGRFADRPTQWLLDIANARGDADYEIVDLRDYPLPYFDEPISPRVKQSDNAVAKRWTAKLDALDGFVFITAEYNHAVTGVLKNALDYVYAETGRKPAAFLGYGAVGGARAVEHLRLILAEQGVASIKSAVHINAEPYLGLVKDGKDFADFPYLADSATTMLDELVWWTKVLAAGRSEALQAQAA
jgi:NAD(P)H-dependent FMN reductase